MTRRPRVYALTLGCDKNLVDSEALLGSFAAHGVDTVADPEAADIWVVNTCGFIEAARRDSLDAIADLAAAKGDRKLVVTGCLSQEQGDRIAADFPAVDVIGGVGNFAQLVETLAAGAARAPSVRPDQACYEGFADRPLLTPGHVAFVKISEGCSFRCAFCRIPMIRGDQRSRRIDDVVDEARRLAARGVREIQLVAQNTSDFGRDAGEDLLGLATALDGVDDLRWIRMLYLYPGLVPTDAMRRILDLPRIVPYLDMPVQHASPAILRRMRRPSDVEALARFFETLRADRPDLVLRTTVLLGFPGEDEEDVAVLADFLARIGFDHVGTYRYSPESGTPAAAMEDAVDPEEIADREARIVDLQAGISLERQQSRLGAVHDLVVDAIAPAEEAAEIVADLAAGDGISDEARRLLDELADGPVARARSRHFGYDLDGVVLLPGEGLAPGDWRRGRFAAASAYDVAATLLP